jgi:hypothetical protein
LPPLPLADVYKQSYTYPSIGAAARVRLLINAPGYVPPVQAHEQGYPAENTFLRRGEEPVRTLVVPLRATGVLFDGLGVLCDRGNNLDGTASVANDSLNGEPRCQPHFAVFFSRHWTTDNLLILVGDGMVPSCGVEDGPFETLHALEMDLYEPTVSSVRNLACWVMALHLSGRRSRQLPISALSRSSEHDLGRQVPEPYRPLVGLAIPLHAQTLHGSVYVFVQIEFVDGVFDVLQDLRLFGQLLRPVRVQVEAERVKVRMNVTTAGNPC